MNGNGSESPPQALLKEMIIAVITFLAGANL